MTQDAADLEAAAQAQAQAMVQSMTHIAAVMSGGDVELARAVMGRELATQSQIDLWLDSVLNAEDREVKPIWGVTLAKGEAQLVVHAPKAGEPGESLDQALKRATLLGLAINPVVRAALGAAGITLTFWQGEAPSRIITPS